MNDQLPIKKIFSAGIKIPFRKYNELIRLGWPFAIYVLVTSIASVEIDNTAEYIVDWVIFCITASLGGVGCHRVFLLPDSIVRDTPTFRWSYRETKFVICSVVIAILGALISLPSFFFYALLQNLDFLPGGKNGFWWSLVFAILILPAAYFLSRWSLILPGSAVDNDHSLSWAWRISSGYSFRLFILIGVLPLMTGSIFELTTKILEPSYFLSLAQDTIWLIVAVIEICMLSLSYEWIISKQKPIIEF